MVKMLTITGLIAISDFYDWFHDGERRKLPVTTIDEIRLGDHRVSFMWKESPNCYKVLLENTTGPVFVDGDNKFLIVFRLPFSG